MPVRPIWLECKRPDCKVEVAKGRLVDDQMVFELKLDDTVTDALVLSDPMPVGSFRRATVVHRENGEHSIVAGEDY